MQTICELDAARVWTGATRAIDDTDGAPLGWVFAEPPDVPEGKAAAWSGLRWDLVVPVDPMPDLRAAASASVMATRAARIVGGFTFQGVRYQTRDDDRENIAGAAQLAFMALVAGAKAGDLFWDGSVDPVTGAPVPFAWIAEDNGTVTMDAPTMVAFGKAAAAFKQGCIFAAFTLKGAIETAPDAAALAAIDLTAGWPA